MSWDELERRPSGARFKRISKSMMAKENLLQGSSGSSSVREVSGAGVLCSYAGCRQHGSQMQLADGMHAREGSSLTPVSPVLAQAAEPRAKS